MPKTGKLSKSMLCVNYTSIKKVFKEKKRYKDTSKT